MKGSRRTRRPYARPATMLGRRDAEVSRLSSLAGAATIERLEPRQLLFSLTITPTDLIDDNIGQVTATFGYTIPYLFPTDEVGDDDEPETIIEDFNDELPQNQNVQVIPSPFNFQNSGLRITHNVTSGARMAVRQQGYTAFGEDPGFTETALAAQLLAGEQFSFFFRSPNGGTANRGVDRVSMDIYGYTNSVGIDASRMRVELLFQGQVITTYTGAALLALNQNQNSGVGQFEFVTDSAVDDVFDQIRFVSFAGPQNNFAVDNVSAQAPAAIFSDIVESRIFGARIVFSGPVGSSIRVLDLYGREMIQTLALGIPPNGEIPLVDLDSDGIPNFNDGIGRIEISGADLRTSLSMVGGTIELDGNFFRFEQIDNVAGLFDDFEDSGFGFIVTFADQEASVFGLPDVGGSVVIGSPFVRPQNNYNPGGFAPGFGGGFVGSGYTNPNQGIFVTDGSSVGSVAIHGVVFGSSQFTGALETLSIGYPLGSFSVTGDLGSFISAVDAGMWAVDADATDVPDDLDAIVKTNATLSVGRTLGQVHIGGRSLLDVSVLGDLSNPTQRPLLDSLRYRELESVQAIDPIVSVAASINAAIVRSSVNSLDGGTGQAYFFADGYLRNDTILSAEFIGGQGTSVIVSGNVGRIDPVNTNEDAADVFAFAVDGTSEIRVELNSLSGQYIRIVDQDGRILGANSGDVRIADLSVFTVTPPAPGVYYVVVMTPGVVDANFASGSNYQFTISGLAPVTFGALRTVGSLGQDNFVNNDGNDVFIQTLGGSMGSIRVGTGYWASNGGESDPIGYINTVEDDPQNVMFWGGGTVAVQSSLYNITLGSDLNIDFDGLRTDIINVFVGGDFGNLVTGLSEAAGAGNNNGLEGDVGNLTLNVGGRVGVIDIRGSIGIDRDQSIIAIAGSLLSINTGTNGGDGSIGMIRVGGHVYGPALAIQTSPGSIVGAFLVSQDIEGDDDSTFIGVWGSGGLRNFNTGFGSDVRFVDAPQIDINSNDTFLPIIGGQVLELIDDGGAKVFISVAGATPGLQVGLVRFLNVDSSQGVAIAEIQVDLAVSGQRLDIVSDGRTGTPVSIGRITITDSVVTSSINITGSGEIDVWRIIQTGGIALEGIRNNTPGGDLVAVDVIGVGTVTLGTGDLGRTEVVPYGPRLLGPYLGLQEGLNGTVGGEIGVPAEVMDGNWSGDINRPVNEVRIGAGEAFLDDIGSPFDGYLNGLVVRTGSVISVIGNGAIGNVILQDAAGELIRVIANADAITPQGRFEGIVGTIFAFIVSEVEVGDGLLQRSDSPFSSTGIFALNEIREVIADNIVGAIISSTISAADSVIDDPLNNEAGGVGTVEMRNGRIIDAFISGSNLDRFWEGSLYDDQRIALANIRDIIVRNGDIFRTQIFGNNIERLQALGGVLDAIFVEATGNVGFITADEYRNSTLGGTALEFFPNAIIVDGNLIELTVNGSTSSTTTLLGTMKDLTVDVVGNLTLLNASDIIRLNLDVDAIIFDITTGRMRASAVRAGELVRLSASDDIVTSTISISGPISSIRAGDAIINSSISVTGPRGRLDVVSANSFLSGAISSSGPIGSITVAAGDMKIDLRTITQFGNVGSISASRDLILTSDVSGTINTISAGRNIGSKGQIGAIVIRGDVSTITAGGALYYDLRVGQRITGGVSIGAVMAKPGNNNVGNGSIIAFGRINQVIAAGDFGGNIISWSGGIGTVVINGSFYKGRTIAAYSGSVDSITINAGHLLGNVHADRDITSLRVVASADGVFGDVGVNPTLSAATNYDARRNQLPVGVGSTIGIDGPRITAGRDIVSFVVTGGSVFETFVHAGRNLVLVDVTGSVHNTAGTTGRVNVFAAGDAVQNLRITGALTNAFVGAGIVNFGADNMPGGTGVNADLVKSGTITGVTLGSASLVDFVAGIDAGADGIYIGADDRTAVGLSSISNISIAGAAATVRVISDSYAGGIDARAIRGNLNRATTDNQILAPNVALPGTAIPGGLTVNLGGGVNARFELTGGGNATWNAANRTLYIANTGAGSTLRVFSPNNGTLNNFNIVSRDDVSIGSILVQAPVTGNSNIKIDGNVGTLALNAFNSTGRIVVGGALGSMTTSAAFSGGFVEARTINTIQITGFFGSSSPGIRGEASISALEIGNVTVAGSFLGLISSDRNITSVSVSGSINSGLIRSGGTIGQVSSNSLSRTWISARDGINAVNIAGDVFDSSIMAGVDLGNDGAFGGTGRGADIITTGNIGTVTIGGNFRESDIVAGIARGFDGFFGTSDDLAAEGRSTIGSITIGGNQTGSNVNSESYLIASTGTIGPATIGGVAARSSGNFKFGPSVLAPVPLQVTDLQVNQSARVYTASIFFNLSIDASTLSRALTVSEVRGTGDVTIRLVEGIDYTLRYDVAKQSAEVTFSRTITERNLPRLSGLPGPGVYRFELDQSILRGSLVNARLDGNGDGVVGVNENYSQDDFVGDAGDKLVDNTAFTIVGGIPIHRVDFLQPFNLDIVLDNNASPNGIADPNRKFTIRGSIGDHPDTNLNYFGPAGDVDLYKVTLQAGQILRLGKMDGSALFAGRVLIDPSGAAIGGGGQTPFALSLPVNGLGDFDLTTESAYLIRQTGEYYIAIANVLSYNDPNTISNIANIPGAVGNYTFSVEIFDDGDSGFNAETDAGDGTAVVNAPVPLDFAGPDRIFGTADDQAVRILGGYTFTLNFGPDGIPNTADDVVTGTSPLGITSTYTTTVVNGQTRGLYTSVISSSIGPAGARGVPGEVWADVDIFHLNNRQTIAPGTRLRITVQLADLGADLGSRSQRSAAEVILSELLFDYRGFVQFGLFDTTNSTGLDDGQLVFSPTDFTGREGVEQVLADNGINSYGFNANGDFYIDFVTPGAIGSDGTVPAKYAVYIQGAFNTDYQIQVEQFGGIFQGPVQQVQNILLETRGGSISWLQVGGISLDLGDFDTRVLGYAGNVPDGRTVDQFLLDNVISQLSSAFNAAGVQVRISTNASDFEFEDYSTVFLTNTFDTVNLINTGFNFFGLGTGLIFNQPFGYSQRSDPLNTNLRDESVVFIPSVSLLGNSQSIAELRNLSQSLTAAVGRRIGEMMGLRITDSFSTVPDLDIMAGNSVTTVPGIDNPYRFSALSRPLSSGFDTIDNTNFFLGRQRSVSLLDRILAPI